MDRCCADPAVEEDMTVETRAAASDRGRSDFARVVQGAATSLTGKVLSIISGLVITILLTRSLGVDQYGAIAVAVAIEGLITGFTSLGLGNGAGRMMAHARGSGDTRGMMRVLKAGLLVGTVTGLVGTAIMFALGASTVFEGSGAATTLVVMAPLVLASALRSVLSGLLRAYGDLKPLLILNVIRPVIDLALIGGLVVLGARGVGAFAGGIVASAFLDLLLIAYFARRGGRWGPLNDVSLEDAKTLLAFSLPLLVSQLLFIGIKSSDVFLLGALRSPAEAGLYSPVMRVVQSSTMFLAAFPLLFVPIATMYAARGKIPEIQNLYVSTTKWAYLLGFPILIALVAVPGDVLPFLFGPDYQNLDPVARILAIGYFVALITGLNAFSLTAVGIVKPMAVYAAIGMVINLGLGLVLIDAFGPTGAAWSNTVSIVFINVAYSIVLFRRSGITPMRRDAVLLFLFSGFVVTLTTLVAEAANLDGLPAMAIAAAGAAAWLAGGLLLKPFAMEWTDITQMFARRREEPPSTTDATAVEVGGVLGPDPSST
jgi:O-antigen/teichoic acid export membrane protein